MSAELKQKINAAENIQAAGLLSTIADMFFKGIGNALDSAAEYEEEMGVLKQINRIPIEGTDGKTYTLKVELSPVRGKDNYYYVEAETNAPGLDVSPLNKKTLKIDNTNMKQFKKTIDDFLEKASYDATFPEDNKEEVNPADVVGEEAESDENNSNSDIQTNSEIDKLIKEINREFEDRAPVAGAGGDNDQMVKFKVIVSPSSDFEGVVTISCYAIDKETWKVDINQKILNEVERKLEFINEDGKIKSFDQLKGEILTVINEISDDNNISKVRSYDKFNASTVIRATLIKDSKTNEVSITAINASTNIRAAMDIVCDLVENSDFLDQIDSKEGTSFEIIDSDNYYDIDTIDYVETDSTYVDMFELVTQFQNKLKTFKWALGSTEWSRDSFLFELIYSIDMLVESMVPWVISHSVKYPVPVSPFGNQATDLYEYKDENDKVDIGIIHEKVKYELEDLIECLDVYYVNLEHDEQNCIDNCLEGLKKILVYS